MANKRFDFYFTVLLLVLTIVRLIYFDRSM